MLRGSFLATQHTGSTWSILVGLTINPSIKRRRNVWGHNRVTFQQGTMFLAIKELPVLALTTVYKCAWMSPGVNGGPSILRKLWNYLSLSWKESLFGGQMYAGWRAPWASMVVLRILCGDYPAFLKVRKNNFNFGKNQNLFWEKFCKDGSRGAQTEPSPTSPHLEGGRNILSISIILIIKGLLGWSK